MRTAVRFLMALALFATASYAEFVYVANSFSNSISGYRINISNGALSAAGVFSAGNYPATVAADPTGRFIYVANCGASLWIYKVNGSTGDISKIGEVVPPAGASGICNIAMTAAGDYVFAADYASGGLRAYRANPATGLLTFTGSAPGPTTIGSIAVDAKSRFVFTENDAAATVTSYAFDSAAGTLALVGTYPLGVHPKGITAEPSGRFVYVADQHANGVFALSVDQKTGALTQLGSVFPTGGCPIGIAAHPAGGFIYAANPCMQNISNFAIDGVTGALTLLGTTPLGGLAPLALGMDPEGRFVYSASNYPDKIQAFTINASGTLNQTGAPLDTGQHPLSVAVSACSVPPVISDLHTFPAILWPPDGKMVDVDIAYEVNAPCGAPLCSVSVSAQDSGGVSAEDWVVTGPHSVMLRAKRAGSAPDRVYTVRVRCEDTRGKSAEQSTDVTVPHDMGGLLRHLFMRTGRIN